MKEVVIVGGGFSGLCTAWFLTRAHPKVKITLLEKSERLGGSIQSIVKEGFLFERGPRSFRRGVTLELVKELGLENELIESSPLAKQRYLWLEGRLQKLNAPFYLRHGILNALIQDLTASRRAPEQESIGAFFSRRIGRSLTEVLIDPLVTGIFGGDLFELSLAACWPELAALEKTYGSLTIGYLARRKKREKGPWLFSFKEGMETLPRTLAQKLSSKVQIHLKTPLEKITAHKDKFHLQCAGLELEADRVIYATACFTPLPTQTLTTINFGWHTAFNLQGFGYLIPSKEREQILGVTFDSSIFNEKRTRLCVMMRGQREDALAIAQEALERHLGIKTNADVIDLHVHRGVLPQHTVEAVGFQRGVQDTVIGMGVADSIVKAQRLCLSP